MAHHVAPADLAPELRMSEQELLVFCFSESIPIIHGRVDRTLVEAQMAANERSAQQSGQSASA
jgi:hypothetical protein